MLVCTRRDAGPGGGGAVGCLGSQPPRATIAAGKTAHTGRYVRYIGNKQKLIPFIRDALAELRIKGSTACDPFAGTASVARFLKTHGFSVTSGDILAFSHALQWAYVVVDQPPRFAGLASVVEIDGDPLAAVLDHLNSREGEPGFIYEHFSPDGAAGAEHDRRYFTPENAARIDALRGRIHEWTTAGRINDDERFILLATLLEAADRIANTTGVYAAYVKSWQPNATRPLHLRPPRLATGTGRACRAFRCDALELVSGLEPFDLLYLDPPYNTRQYVGYYHIPEIIAEGWFLQTPTLRGKTGLPEDGNKRSDWSRRRHCETIFEQLVDAARCRHILMSYNSEGIIAEDCIERVLRERGLSRTYRRFEKPYKRYRSDRDSESRRYKCDHVTEHLYYVTVS